MSSNGTPQSALYNLRPTNDTRDRSMEQDYTNSGNPYGYMPQYGGGGQMPNLGRYAPPMQQGGPWGAANFGVGVGQGGPYSYNLPNSYGTGTLPSGASYYPQYAPPPGQSSIQPPNYGTPGGTLTGASPVNIGGFQPGSPTPQPATYQPQMQNPNTGTYNGAASPQPLNPTVQNNGVESNGTLPAYNPRVANAAPPAQQYVPQGLPANPVSRNTIGNGAFHPLQAIRDYRAQQQQLAP
jgi:hypothetical protein